VSVFFDSEDLRTWAITEMAGNHFPVDQQKRLLPASEKLISSLIEVSPDSKKSGLGTRVVPYRKLVDHVPSSLSASTISFDTDKEAPPLDSDALTLHFRV